MKSLWPIKKLGEICELVRGSEPGSESYFDEINEERIRFIRVGDISGKVDQPKFIDKKLSNLVVVNPDEILISFDGTPGIVARGWSGAIASGIRVIRDIKPEILKEFLFYYLQTSEPQKVIKFYTTGVTILHASRAIPHIKIPLPPLKIQQKIVERLDAIKKVQELNDKQIELAEELFQSLLHRELDPKGKKWEVKRIKQILSSQKFTVGKLNRDKYQKSGQIPIIDQGDNEIAGYSDNKNLVYTGELPIVIYGDHTRIVKYVDFPFIIGADGVKILNPKKEILIPKYLYYALHCFNVESRGYKRHFPILKEKEIPLPPLETQQKIVEKLSAVQEYKNKLLDQKQKLQELFESVLNKSFSRILEYR